MRKVISFIRKEKIGSYKTEEKMSDYTTFKAGGIAALVCWPKDKEKLVELLKKLKSLDVNYKIIGKGSNLIISDKYYNGVFIKLDSLNDIKVVGSTITVGAGVSLMKVAYLASKKGLSGLEFACGIPGTIGGAIYMNAGAYKSDMGYITTKVNILTPDLQYKTLFNKDMNFKYRSSYLSLNKDCICLSATLVLKFANKKDIKDLIETRKQKRLLSQPYEYPSAGSTFRNPVGDFAGKLIEDCNLKGFTIGGARVSNKHANFIINVDNASADDIYNLIKHVSKTVKQQKNVDLKLEQEVFNWE